MLKTKEISSDTAEKIIEQAKKKLPAREHKLYDSALDRAINNLDEQGYSFNEAGFAEKV